MIRIACPTILDGHACGQELYGLLDATTPDEPGIYTATVQCRHCLRHVKVRVEKAPRLAITRWRFQGAEG